MNPGRLTVIHTQTTGETMKIFELCISLLSSAVFLYLLTVSISIRYIKSFWSGSGAVPAVISGFLLFFSLVWAIDTFIEIQQKSASVRKPVLLTFSNYITLLSGRRNEILRFIAVVGMTIIYIYILMPAIGFVFASALFLIVSIYLFGQMHWFKCIFIGVSVSGLIYVAFRYFLHLPLPH